MDEQQLQAIKERVENATGTQWQVGMESPNGIQNVGTMQGLMTAQVLKIDDAEFIAHARQDVPALIAEVERLRKALSYYANVDNYITFDSPAIKDKGEKARQTLKGGETNE